MKHMQAMYMVITCLLSSSRLNVCGFLLRLPSSLGGRAGGGGEWLAGGLTDHRGYL